ncbi:heat-inducible transcriptional repressor HrcA [Tessaracoccus sp. SD287]|uniref:heat-inducible transcriptional repressor HrcA n=1 Tax=Tessaracoccus sp. SD287 TaxID=2782008 RepID=UPI001A95B5E3|nr:heat-inducible transcriptional repressor HrcA [Tessaracoccus sp. SD287]
MVDERKIDVLRAIVTDYVASREPVGSKALVERHNMKVSAATVRNDMAVLEDEGYITQPHTSAGRIPTDKGYRLFVDRLGAVKPLSVAEKRAVTTFMSGAVDLDDIVSRTVRLLAQLTRQVAIVQYPSTQAAVIRHVELVSLTVDRALVVLITSSGRVEQRVLDLPTHTEDQLASLRQRLNAAVADQLPSTAADRLHTVVDETHPEERVATNTVVATLLEMLATDPSARIVVAGVPNLTRFAENFETAVQPVLEALEEQVVLLRLLGETRGDDVTVRIGQENPYQGLQSTSLVTSSYGDPGHTWASLGVVGPTRMDYPSTIASVRAVARYLSRFLAEG